MCVCVEGGCWGVGVGVWVCGYGGAWVYWCVSGWLVGWLVGRGVGV